MLRAARHYGRANESIPAVSRRNAVIHAAYVAFITTGFSLIVIGIACAGMGARFPVSCGASGAIALVCAESLMRAARPLTTLEGTTLEGRLRAISGKASHSRHLLGSW